MENFYRDINLIFLKTVSKDAVQICCLLSKKSQTTVLLKWETTFW